MHRLLLVTAALLFAMVHHLPVQQAKAKEPDEINNLSAALNAVKSKEDDVCIKGLNAILRYAPANPDNAIPRTLVFATRHRNAEVRTIAFQVCGKLASSAPGYRLSLPFATGITDQEQKVRVAALEAIHAAGGPAKRDELRSVLELLDDKDVGVRNLVYANLVRCAENTPQSTYDLIATATPPLLKRLATESPEDPSEKMGNPLRLGIRALGKVGRRSPDTIPFIIKQYSRFPGRTKHDAQLRTAVVEAIADVGPFSDKGLRFLSEKLRDEQLAFEERAIAAWAIGQFGIIAAPFVSDMISLLRSELQKARPDEKACAAIVTGFVSLGETSEPAIPLLLEIAIQEAPGALVDHAIRALGGLSRISRKQAAPVLAKLYFARATNTHDAALLAALAQFEDTSTQIARDKLNHSEVAIESKAIQLLLGLGRDARVAVPDLKRIAEDKTHPLQADAALAIRLIEG
jgi:hypothetical protein